MRGARGCEGRTVCIEAAAGLGKTRLLRRLRERGGRVGMLVASARGTELEREFPYGVVRQLFEPVLGALGQSERAALFEGAAAGAHPVLDPEPGRGFVGPGAAEDLSFSTLYGLYWLTANLSQAGPLLLAVDDAHWADSPSAQFLRFLSTRLDGLPILLAIGARPVEATSPLAAIGSDASTVTIRPAPLGLESAAELLAEALGSPAERSFAAACHKTTGGNPFLVTELARELAAESVEPTARNAEIVRRLVPETILRAVLRRLAALDEPARKLARAVAILGDGCEPHRAAALADLDADAGAEAADALREVEILEPEPPLRFAHPLVRNAIYAEVPAGARSREHQRAAALLTAEGLPVERVAIHLLATDPAGDVTVVDTLRAAAEAALDQGAPEPAIAYLHRALREPTLAPARGDLLELLITASLRAADPLAVAPFQEEAFATLAGDAQRLVRSAEGLATLLLTLGKAGDALEVFERGIAAAEAAGDFATAVGLETQLITFTLLPPKEAEARLSRYEGRVDPDSPQACAVLALRSWWMTLSGANMATTVPMARRALTGRWIAAGRHDPASWAQGVLVLIRADELDAAEEAAESMIASATERGAVASLAGGWFMRGSAALRRGDLHRAEADARQIAELRGFRHDGFLAIAAQLFATLLIDVLIERDELDAADRELAGCGMEGEIPEAFWLWPVLVSRGRLRLAQGRARDAARDLLEMRRRMEAWGAITAAGLPAGTYGARALAVGGDIETARSIGREQLERARLWGAPSGVAEGLAALGVVLGGDEGIDLLRQAVDILEAAPARLLHAATLTDLGALLRRERRPVEAREPLRAALAIARRCGGVAVARRAAHELEAAGEKVQRYTPIGADALTASERRVAEMAARGMTNREIAASLFITVKTVESHLSATYDKLGVRARTELTSALEPSAVPAASGQLPAIS